MRITNNIFQRNALAALQVNAKGLATAQKRVSTGMRFERASEDPAAASSVMESQSSLRAIDQYRRNIGTARSFTAAEESAIDRLSDILARAQELAMAQADASAGSDTRSIALKEVEQLYQQAVQISNTQFGGRFLFGGETADVQPVTVDGLDVASVTGTTAAAGPKVQIASSLQLRANHNAVEAFDDTLVFQALGELRTALEDAIADPTTADLLAPLSTLRTATDRTQNLLGELGSWSSQLDVTTANLDALEINLKTFKAELQEVDLEAAVTDMVGRQNAYQAAMLATSKVMGLTLANYLR